MKSRCLFDGKPCYLIALRTIVFMIFMMILFTAASHARTENLSSKKVNEKVANSCGPRSLATVLSLLGYSVDHSRCATLSGTDDKGTTTLAGLLTATRALGKSAKGMCLTPQELALINRPAILHVCLPNEEDHFVVFTSSDGVSFELIDPTRNNARETYTANQLRLMWKGNCLVFTHRPFWDLMKISVWRARGIVTALCGMIFGILVAVLTIAKLSQSHWVFFDRHLTTTCKLVIGGLALLVIIAPIVAMSNVRAIANEAALTHKTQLVLGASTLNLGEVEWGLPFKTSIWFGNYGSSTLTINSKKIKTSCSCVRSSISKSELHAGDKGYLQIKLSPPRKMGPFRYSVYIPSNDPQKKNSVLVIKGQVTGPGGVVYPPRLYFGHLDNLEEAHKSLVYIVRQPGVEVLRVTTNSPFITCSFEPYSSVFKVHTLLTKLPKSGAFDGSIRIITNDPMPEYREIVVPFHGIVMPKTKSEFQVKKF